MFPTRNSDESPKATSREGEKQVAGMTVRVVVHRKPFNFDGVDRSSILGKRSRVKTLGFPGVFS